MAGRPRGTASTARRFPPPWLVEDIDAAFVVKDGSGQKVAYVYYALGDSEASPQFIVVIIVIVTQRSGRADAAIGLFAAPLEPTA